MNANSLLPLALAALAGLAIGAVYFSALWWTVQRGASARRPALLFLASFVARTAFALGAFYLLGGRHADRLAVALLGFIVSRVLVVRLTGSSTAKEKA